MQKLICILCGVLLTVATFTGCQTEIEQVNLGELPVPVYIRTVMWDVNGFRLADGRKNVTEFANVIENAKVTFAVLFGLDPTTASADVEIFRGLSPSEAMIPALK